MIEYQPISCAQHERLEFSVLRKIPLQIEFRQGPEKIRQTVMPLDVATRSGAEWLKFRVSGTGEVIEIRLDSIISFAEQLPS
ncbi:MAG: transcriptional antiterminator, Rof [Nitrosomonadales bacterium]|nr:MAG: transcriptional antiterminator, Rof [Nitrosomonadales bacterium]